MLELIKIFTLTFPLLIPGLALILVLKLKLFKFLDIPLDLGKSINGKRIFGDNKTFKGVAIMVSVAILVSNALYLLYKNGYAPYIGSIFSESPIFIGTIYSFSYIAGELINSFIKRQMNISSGKISYSKFRNFQAFFDLSDGIIVVVLVLIIFTSVSTDYLLAAGFIGIFLHYLTDVFMNRLGLKQEF